MNFYDLQPIAAVLDGAYSIITALSSALNPVFGDVAAALVVVLVTLLVRVALIPVGVSRVRAEITRRRLAPQLAELKRKYGKNRELLQRKTLELYAREKASPVAGCLPTLAQVPVVSTVYGLFSLALINGHSNLLLLQQLAGVNLGTSLLALLGSGGAWPGVLVFAALLAVIAGVTWLSRRMAANEARPASAASGARSADTSRKPQLTGPAVPADGPHSSTGVISWLPFMTVGVAAIVPLAATLYLAVTTAWTLAERVIVRRILDPEVSAAQ